MVSVPYCGWPGSYGPVTSASNPTLACPLNAFRPTSEGQALAAAGAAASAATDAQITNPKRTLIMHLQWLARLSVRCSGFARTGSAAPLAAGRRGQAAPRPCVRRIPLGSRLARLYSRNERGRLIGGGRQQRRRRRPAPTA